MPYEQKSDLVWYQARQMGLHHVADGGRAERSDPDELLYNLFVQSTAKDGYNFVGYNNPDYEKVVEAQRAETDPPSAPRWSSRPGDPGQDQPYDQLRAPDDWTTSSTRTSGIRRPSSNRPASASRTSGPLSAPSRRATRRTWSWSAVPTSPPSTRSTSQAPPTPGSPS